MGEVGTREPGTEFYSLGRQHLCTVPVAGALIQQGWRERCVCLLHPSQPLHCPAELGICPGDALAQVALVPSVNAVSQPCPSHRAHSSSTGLWACYTLCQTQGAPIPECCCNGTKAFEPKAAPESSEEDVDGLEQCITKHFGDRAGSDSLQLMVGNPCHRPVVLAESSPQFQPHLCDLPQSWMKPAEFRLLQAFQGCQAPGQAVLSNSIAAS